MGLSIPWLDAVTNALPYAYDGAGLPALHSASKLLAGCR